MNSSHFILGHVAALTLSGLAAVLVSQPGWAVDCSKPAGFTERRACEKASQGVVALQRYAERTRAIHNLHLPDYEKALPAKDLAQTKRQDIEVAQTEPR